MPEMPVTLDDSFSVNGHALAFDDADRIKEDGCRKIDQHGEGSLHVDLGGLTQANSLTVAVMMVWYRHAYLQEKTLRFTSLSEDLRNMIEFSGLGSVLLPDSPE